MSSELESITFHAGTLCKLVAEPRIQICRIHCLDSASVSCRRYHCNSWYHRGWFYQYDLVDYLQDIVQYIRILQTRDVSLQSESKRIQEKLPTTSRKLCCSCCITIFSVFFVFFCVFIFGRTKFQLTDCIAKASKCIIQL